MKTKAIDGVSISQLQNKFMTGDELIPVEYDGKNYNINTRDIFNNVSDYNVSVLFPNDSINGDNKYDLEQACKILKPYFDNQNAKHGFIISFYNSDNIIEKWLFCKDNIAPNNFMKINTYENPNNYIGVLKKGVYPNKYVIFKGKQFAGLSISINFKAVNDNGAIVGYDENKEIVLYYTESFTAKIPDNLVTLNIEYNSIEIIDDIILQICPIELNKRLSNDEKKIQKIYDAVFEIPLISLPQINIGGNIENNIVIENGYLSTYYQNTTKNIQNIIIKGTANPYINNYPLYGFSNTKPIVGTTLENVAVAKKKGEVVEHKTTINPNQYIYINGNENKLKIYEVKDEQEKNIQLFNIIRQHNSLYNKKYVAAGDSFTEAIFEAFTDENGLKGKQSPEFWDSKWNCWKSYAYHIAKRNEMIFYPNGVSGSTIHDNGNKNAFCKERYKNTDKIPLDTDYLTLMFGLNETNLVTDDKIGDKNSVDDTTWWGAWNKVLEYYITNMPYCKIGIIIADAWFHKTLRDELIKISNYWGIPYLDLKGDLQVPMMLDGRYDNSIINSKAIQLRNKAFQTSDTDHHPNPKGHLYRSTIIENFLRRL